MNKHRENGVMPESTREEYYIKHDCVQCCHNGFEKYTCRIQVVMPSAKGTIYTKAPHEFYMPTLCPYSLNKNRTLIPLLPESHYKEQHEQK